MSSMLFVSRIGAPEGALTTACREAGEDVYVYDISSHEILPSRTPFSKPTWIHEEFSGGDYLRNSYFDNLIDRLNINRILATGLQASEFALNVLPEHNVVTILHRGDLNFSVRRAHLMRAFNTINDKSMKLFLEDSFEMDKAVGLGARVPLLRFPTHVVEKQRILAKDQKRIGLLYSTQTDAVKLERQLQLFEVYLGKLGYETKRVNIDTMFSLNDMRMGRGFPGTMRYRIGDCSHVVIFGDSRNTSSVLSGLSNESEKVFIEDTINSHLLYSGTNFNNYGRGYSLLRRISSFLTNESNQPAEKFIPQLASQELPKFIDEKMKEEHPEEFEEIIFNENGKYFDVFFSVAPLENRTNGARPQRIRNMALVMQDGTNCVRVSPHENMLRRRGNFIQSLVEAGYFPRFVYGENSTSPMASFETIHNVSQLFSFLKSNGAKLGWFVRDLHWLSDDASGIRDNQAEMQAMINRGLFELREISKVTHQFFAPHESSVDAFKTLLRGMLNDSPWQVLPPGTAWTNSIEEARELGVNTKLTLTYSGGIQGIYRMDTFIEAVAPMCLANNVFLDFVVRKEDTESLNGLLAQFGLEASDGVRIIFDEFEDYEPRTPKAIGVIILDTDYAKAAFPYKTVSMLEKGMPILTCDDMAISEFVSSEAVGCSVPRSLDSIREGIERFIHEDWNSFDVGTARVRHSWQNRIDFVRTTLAARN